MMGWDRRMTEALTVFFSRTPLLNILLISISYDIILTENSRLIT